MQRRRALSLLLPLLMLAACTEDQSPTAPTSPAEPGGPAFSHTPGHKVVNSLADPGNGTCNATQCTLREAINDPQSTEISFAPGLTGPITLARPAAGGGLLEIDKTLTITGPSIGIVIQRRSTDPTFRIVRIGTGVTVKLTNLTIRNGKTDLGGGGIVNFGTLALTHCTVSGNSAIQGGGIDNHGPLTVTNSTIANNSGGGIANYAQGTLTLTSSMVARNSGSGIGNRGKLTVTNSTVVDNSGTGISASGGSSTVTHTRIAHNSSTAYGGGIFNTFGEFTLINSTVARNSAAFGGGIANRILGTITITGSTVVGNSATVAGGGIYNILGGFRRVPASVRLTNSTVSGNSAPAGGGIFNSAGNIGLRSSTVALNSASQEGGGIRQIQEAQLGLVNSLVARNSAPIAPDVLASPDVESFVGAFFSLIGDGSGSGLTNTDGNQVGNVSPNSSPIDPKLGPLADNGGPTRTHALLLGSPAIDAASTPDCPTTDQRGVSRPQGAACDIGSYERK
jgi:CSLREA domain-containing protein